MSGIPTNPPVDAARIGTGQPLGKYQLVRSLGRGGMGEVWLARDTVARIDVAVKFLPIELRNSEEAQEQLSDSYRRVHGLHHPHICAVKDLILDPDLGYFLVMDYFEGVTLARYRKDYIKQHGSFPLSEMLRVLKPVADALDYAHSQNLLHRDIKPGNILVSVDGSRVRVIDFQLATEVRATLSRYTNTQFDTSGTYPYMAPEQFRGAHATPATDQYALAMTAYELLAGRLPFDTLGWDLWKGVVTDPQTQIPPIPALNQQAQISLSRSLGLDPRQRAASCQAFLAAFSTSDAVVKSPVQNVNSDLGSNVPAQSNRSNSSRPHSVEQSRLKPILEREKVHEIEPVPRNTGSIGPTRNVTGPFIAVVCVALLVIVLAASSLQYLFSARETNLEYKMAPARWPSSENQMPVPPTALEVPYGQITPNNDAQPAPAPAAPGY